MYAWVPISRKRSVVFSIAERRCLLVILLVPVQDLDPVTVRDDEDVLRLEIAVNHARGVDGNDALGDLSGEAQRAGNAQRSHAEDFIAQGAALEQLHREPSRALRNSTVGDLDDVGMAHLGEGAGLGAHTLSGCPLAGCGEP